MDIFNSIRTNKIAQLALLECIVLLVSVTLLYQSAILAMFELWMTSETYSHGLFILPLTVILIVNRINKMNDITPKPLLFAGPILFGLGVAWLFFELAGINVLSQLVVTALLPAAVLVRYGWQVFYQLKGPLLFLFLAVPVGDFLIPHLQQITATLSIAMIEFAGIPVFSNGLYISIPEGNFLVAEACSGIRFLISSITIGIFYALLYLDNPKNRLIMILSGAFVPIVANGVRVFIIILIAHLGNIEAATGFDHIVYGWVFFSIVMVLLIILGNVLANNEAKKSAKNKTETSVDSSPFTTKMKVPVSSEQVSKFTNNTMSAYLVIIVGLITGPLVAAWVYAMQPTSIDSSQNETVKINEERYIDSLSFWAVSFPSADIIERTSPQTNAGITQYVVTYLNESAKKELISFDNRLFNPDRWSIKDQSIESLSIHNSTLSEHFSEQHIFIKKIRLVSLSGKQRIVLMVYKIGQVASAKPINIKLQQVWHKLTGQDFGGQAIIVSGNIEHTSEAELNQALLTLLAAQLEP